MLHVSTHLTSITSVGSTKFCPNWARAASLISNALDWKLTQIKCWKPTKDKDPFENRKQCDGRCLLMVSNNCWSSPLVSSFPQPEIVIIIIIIIINSQKTSFIPCFSWFWFHFCSPGFIWSEETFHLSKQQVCRCRETITCLPTEILAVHLHIRTFLESTKPVSSNNTRICVWFESTHSSHLAALEVWVASWSTTHFSLKLHAWPDSQGCLLVSNNYGREFCTPSKVFTNLNTFGFRVSKPVRKFWKWKLNGPHPQCSPDSKLGVISDFTPWHHCQ